MRAVGVRLAVAGLGSAGIAGALWSASSQPSSGTSSGTSAWLTLLGCSSLVLVASVCVSLRAVAAALWLALLSSLWWTLDATNRPLAPGLTTAIEVASRAALPVAVLAALALIGRTGRRPRPLVFGLMALTAATVVAVSQVDPFINPDCWRNCVPNGMSLLSDPGTQAWLRWVLVTVGLAWCAVAFGAFVDWARRRRKASASVVDSEVFAGLACVALVASLAYGAVSAVAADLEPRAAAAPGYAIACAAAAGLSVSLCLTKLAADRRREELRRVASGLLGMQTPDALEDSLRRALVDPELTVLYWVEARQAWVDGSGDRVTDPGIGPGRDTTTIVRGDAVVARLQHSRSTNAEPVESWIGSALRLTIENAGLIAASRGELSDLRASRERIVTRADDERVRLERDLHDGAQQRVVGLALRIGMLRDDARRTGSLDLTRAERLVATTDSLLHELRAVARGIHPAVLDDAGLEAALLDLAEGQAEVEVGVLVDLAARPDPRVEAGLYLVVETALADAVARSAALVDVGVTSSGRALRVDIVDDGLDRATPSGQLLVDRVAVLGGSVHAITESVTATSVRHVVRAELPCVS